MDVPALANQQELIYISSVQTQDIIWKTCRERWMRGTDWERERESQGNACCQRELIIMKFDLMLFLLRRFSERLMHLLTGIFVYNDLMSRLAKDLFFISISFILLRNHKNSGNYKWCLKEEVILWLKICRFDEGNYLHQKWLVLRKFMFMNFWKSIYFRN